MKKILATLIIYFSYNSVAFTENIILICGYKFKPDYYFIDNIKETISGLGINKREKILEIYDWSFDNVKFENDKVSFNTDGNFLFHIPENFPFYKKEIDRDTLQLTFYEKDLDDLPNFLLNFPSAIINQARKRLKWKFNDSYKCEIINKQIYEHYSLKRISLEEIIKRETYKRENKF
tara:strand:+ start:107 stop:637 length:531 start_codon:yes stop_codon:yes gene_type:complete